jgi:hypothetical protein
MIMPPMGEDGMPKNVGWKEVKKPVIAIAAYIIIFYTVVAVMVALS